MTSSLGSIELKSIDVLPKTDEAEPKNDDFRAEKTKRNFDFRIHFFSLPILVAPNSCRVRLLSRRSS